MSTYIPSAAPLPSGWIDGIWRATKAGALSWSEATHLQTVYSPRCLTHDQPITALSNGVGVCMRCVEEQIGGGDDSSH